MQKAVISHADEDVPPITTSERHKRTFLLRIQFTGETAIPAQHLHTMVKLYTTPLDQSICEADMLTLEALAKDMGLPGAELPESRIFM